MNLFRIGNFTLASGKQSSFKIDCDALTTEDWACIAKIISEKFLFTGVFGVPTGGLPLQQALTPYSAPKELRHLPTLLVDDVWTTGGSMRTKREELCKQTGLHESQIKGIVVFARGKTDDWVYPIFTLND